MNRKTIAGITLGLGLLALVSCGGRDSSPESSTERAAEGPARNLIVTYRFTVQDVAAGAKNVAAWVPVPPSNTQQTLEGMDIEGDLPYEIVSETEYGNRFLRFDLSQASRGAAEIPVTVTFRVNRQAHRALPGAGPVEKLPDAVLARYLAPDHLVPIDGKIAEEAKRVAGDAGDSFSKARRLYDHIVSTMKYDKSGKGWGRGDAIYACDVRAGNCTDFHSLFIGEARSLEIPARFVMGIPVPEDQAEGTIAGYHCWAEFYVDDWGWVPIDASEANKHPEKREVLFAALDPHRVQFSIGRDIHLPGSRSEPVNYSIHPHVEVDGRVQPEVKASFSFKETGGEGTRTIGG
jgi:transglutaminase-like putative cysteine protease